MATRAGSMIQDQNFNVQFSGETVLRKTNVSKGVKKGGAGGRKPLGDLSNSGKPSINQAPKQFGSKNFTFIKEENVTANIRNDAPRNKSVSKASEKLQTTNRKALTDISNSGKPHVQHTREKQSMKMNAYTEEPLHLSAIAEEQFLHNHQECIKSQSKAMEKGQFLRTVGLDKDVSAYLAFPSERTASNILRSDNHLKYLELEEMAEEEPTEVRSTTGQLDSPHCKSPKSPNLSTSWKDSDINFKLMETPALSKY
ncbi:neuron navigator 1-like [Quillaja saponaria]|uniref:Neuron navigator 1-like n=1 Tax=Quillaja saponaria TaxID=32244 RepID=A0AAD7PVZ9_QUISA|nr:neuron navigator 1-like [Quillaja saponaria]